MTKQPLGRLRERKKRVRKQPLRICLHACEPSVVELTVGDRVQLDRLIPSPRGYLAERHGRLLGPGVTTVAVPPGHYFFKTLSDAKLRVVTGGVPPASSRTTRIHGRNRRPRPTSPAMSPPASYRSSRSSTADRR